MSNITLDYDETKREAVLTFKGGRQMKLSGVTREKAEAFRDQHGAEFERRDCCLTTAGVIVTREAPNG